MAIKAVFFDAGGTLFQPYPSVGELYANTAAKFGGGEFEPEAIEAGFQVAWKRRNGLASLGDETSEQKEREWWYSLVSEVFKPLGAVPKFDDFFDELQRLFVKKESWFIFPDTIKTLEFLRKRGVKRGVVSNWDLRLNQVLRNLGLTDYFDFVVGSSFIGATKPHPKIFEEALHLSNCRAEEAIHVGDTFEEDFLGAQALGIHAYLIDRKGNSHLAPHEKRIRSLEELCRLTK